MIIFSLASSSLLRRMRWVEGFLADETVNADLHELDDSVFFGFH
jgi:hypothetical protein